MSPVPSRLSLADGWTCTTPAGPFAKYTGEMPPVVEVTLPHDAMRDAERTPDAPSGGSSGFYPGGVWRYVRTLRAEPEWADGWVSLEFDGAYAGAKVYVDDVLVAHRPNGYVRFHVDLTPHLRYGADNVLRVDVRTHQDSRWYSGAGLHREVHLQVGGIVHVAPDGVSVTTPDVDDEWAAVEVRTEVVNDGTRRREVTVTTQLRDPDGTLVVTDTVPVTVPAGRSVTVRRRLWVPEPQRWSPGRPQLYEAQVAVTDGEERLDERTARFGIRTIRYDPHRGFRVNDEPLKLRGTCIHADNGILGAASHPAAERRRVRLLLEAGFNAIRMAHHPASQALLDACDELGMLVMNEAFDMWGVEKTPYDYSRDFHEWWRRDLEAMVAGSVNHPSVVMYSIGNEVLELGRADGRVLSRDLAEAVRSLDPTRPVTNGIQMLFLVDVAALMAEAGGLNELLGGLKDRWADDGQGFAGAQNVVATTPDADAAVFEAASVLDITGYNYAEERYAFDAEHHPNRVSVGSETFPTRIGKNWELVQAHSNVLGDFTWTGWDYLGEAGIGGMGYAEDGAVPPYGVGYPKLLAFCGDIDITGWRRPASYYREIVFGLRDEPFIAVGRPERHDSHVPVPNAWQWSDTIASWTWPGFEGKPIRLEVYGRGDEVELLVNGRSLGRAPVGSRRALMADFDVVYEPGELVAVAYTDGVETGRTSLVTAGDVAAVNVRVEEETVPVDGLAYVVIELVDADGRLVTADRQVLVEVSGPVTLAGLGSARWRTEERFDATGCTTFDGRAQAVLRPTGPGQVRVTVRSEALPDATATVTVG